MPEPTPNPDHDQIACSVARAIGDAARSGDLEVFENALCSVLMEIGRLVTQRRIEQGAEDEPFEEGGVTWKPVSWGNKSMMTSFGTVQVRRPRFRARRNGPSRCLLDERFGLLRSFWTPRAARLAAIAGAELTLERTEQLLEQIGGMKPSAASLHRLNIHVSELWEAEREENEKAVRECVEIPAEAVTVVPSLDGVMVNTLESGADRKKKKANTRARGQTARGPAGYKEASVGVISFYDKEGNRLLTRRTARMPEPDKKATKAWVEAELAHVRSLRPNLTVVATADGTPNNWSFLETLSPDHEVVDFFHTTEHVHRHLTKANGAGSLETQALFKEMKRQLIEEDDGAKEVFSKLRSLRQEAGTSPVHKEKTKANRSDKRKKNYFDHHKDRMAYAELRRLNLPIGSGVTEGTCRHLVVDRLRRSGMRWSQVGGQAVMTLRALWVNDDFPAAWPLIRHAAAKSRRAA